MGFVLGYRSGRSLRFCLKLGVFILLPFVRGSESDDGRILQGGLCVTFPHRLVVCVKVDKVGDDLVDIVRRRFFYPRISRELCLCTKFVADSDNEVVK